MLKTAQKIIFLARVIVFQKSVFACNYSARKNFKRPQLKTHLIYLFEKTTHQNMLKIGTGVPGMVSEKFGLGIFKYFHFMSHKVSKSPIWPPFLTFFSQKRAKIKKSKSLN